MADPFAGLEAFVRTAEARSFSAAARTLGISASGVSNAVKRLESDLGVQLFNRTTRSVGLTEEGEVFFQRCRAILTELAEAREALGDRGRAPKGRLKVSLPRALGARAIVPRLAQFRESHPAVTFEIDLDDRVADLVEGGYDVAVRIVAAPRDSRLIARQLGRARLVTCAAPAYLGRFGTPERPADLRQHDCLRLVYPDTGRARAWRFRETGAVDELTLAGTFGSNGNEALVAAALAGLGIIQVHDYHVRDELTVGRLVELLPGCRAPGAAIQALYPRTKHLTPRVRAFVDFLVQLQLGDAGDPA